MFWLSSPPETADSSEKEDKSNFVEPTVVRFTEKDAVKSPYGDVKNIPFTDDSIIIITDYQTGDEESVANDYDDDYEDEEIKEDIKTKVP